MIALRIVRRVGAIGRVNRHMFPAVQHIVAAPPNEDVVARPTQQNILTLLAIQPINPITTQQHIIIFVALHLIVGTQSHEQAGPAGIGRLRIGLGLAQCYI